MRLPALAIILAAALAPFGCPSPDPEGEVQADGEPRAEGEAQVDGDGEPSKTAPVTTADEGGAQTQPPATATTKAPAPDTGSFAADLAHSKVGFAVARATSEHIGHFERFSATLTLAAGVPTGLEIAVETGSVVADRQGLSSHLKSPDFFDVGKFPTATFTAKTFTPDAEEGPDAYQVEGSMALHGVERPLKFPAKITLEPERAVGTASLDISAKAFGIDYAGMEEELAEDDVSLEIELHFPRVSAAPSP